MSLVHFTTAHYCIVSCMFGSARRIYTQLCCTMVIDGCSNVCKTPEIVVFQSWDLVHQMLTNLQDSLQSLFRILHRVVRIVYVTILEMLPTTSRNTSKTSRPSLISSSNIWIACTRRVCATGTSVTIIVSLKSIPAWKDMHKYTHINKMCACFILFFKSHKT